MKWEDRGESEDVEDRRGEGGYGGGGFGGRSIGLGGFLLLLVLSVVFKRNFFALLGDGGAGTAPPPVAGAASPGQEKLVHFVSFVLDDVQSTWARELQSQNRPYHHAK